MIVRTTAKFIPQVFGCFSEKTFAKFYSKPLADKQSVSNILLEGLRRPVAKGGRGDVSPAPFQK